MALCRNKQLAAMQALELLENLWCGHVSFFALASLLNDLDPMSTYTPYTTERRQEEERIFDVLLWDGEVLLDREVRE